MDYMKLADSIQTIREAGGDEDTLIDLIEQINKDFKEDPGFSRHHFYRAAMGPA